MKLQGKVSIITGGSMGIGKAVAQAFAREGSSLVLVARNRPELEATREALRNSGSEVEIFLADVSKERDVKAMVAFALEKFSTVDVLVNCAGILGPLGLITDNNSEEWLKAIGINLFGTFLCGKAVLPIMVEKKKGKIINFSGGGGSNTPRVKRSAYGTSKAAVIRLTEVMALEYREHHIDVNALAPGSVNTRMVYQRLDAKEILGKEEEERALRQLEKGGVPPEKVAAMAVFLASSESDGLSGKEMNVPTDAWQTVPEHLTDIMSSDVYSMRRVEPRDRGYIWQK